MDLLGPPALASLYMALATRTDRKPSLTRTFWGSTVGKKTVMAVSGLIMLGYLVAHVMGNLKVFFGAGEFNAYGHWLRTMGEPVLHYSWGLWIVRVVLLAAVVGHGVSAYQLSKRDLKARPVPYAHKRRRAATPPAPCVGAASSWRCSSSGICWT